MPNRRCGGSSPTKERKYKAHYEKLSKRNREKLEKLKEKLETKYPDRKYEIVSHEKITNSGNNTTRYTIRRK